MRNILGNFLRVVAFALALAAFVVVCGGVGWYIAAGGIGSLVSGAPGAPGGESPIKLTGASLEETLIGLYLNFRRADIERPVSEADVPVLFTIEQGETAVSIAARLEEMGLVRDADLFRLYLRHQGIDASLEAGDYDLSPNMNMVEIAQTLQHARVEEFALTIPEGWRAEQVAAFLSEQGVMNGDEFLELVEKGGDFDYEFLRDRPAGSPTSLEGFLFPETYRLPVGAGPEALLRRMLNTFDRRVSREMRAKAAQKGWTIYEVVTLASIVEREAVVPEERPLIASVYLNRLAAGMLLGADPTVQYALGYQPTTGQWWKTPMSLEEYSLVDSPYNTYLYPGLPPGPICSPGLDSIRAVIEPAQSDYYYFVARGDGSHVFARTVEEHERNVRQFQQ